MTCGGFVGDVRRRSSELCTRTSRWSASPVSRVPREVSRPNCERGMWVSRTKGTSAARNPGGGPCYLCWRSGEIPAAAGQRSGMADSGSLLGPRRSCGGGPWWQWRGGVAKPQRRGALRRNGVAELWRVRLLGLLAAAAGWKRAGGRGAPDKGGGRGFWARGSDPRRASCGNHSAAIARVTGPALDPKSARGRSESRMRTRGMVRGVL